MTSHETWKHPGRCDYRQIHRRATSANATAAHRHQWQIMDYVDIHGNQRADLRFEMVLTHQGLEAVPVVGFVFFQDGALSVWPFWLSAGQPADGSLRLVPQVSAHGVEQFALALQSLSTTDWQLLCSLCELMVSQYAELAQGDEQMTVWLACLQKFAKILAAWPWTLRFDHAVIERVVHQGDYAHLALSLSNVITPRGVFERWGFRLATVVADDVFDANPRFEFGRDGSENVFEKWFVESRNAFGENLELRFAKQDHLVDLPLVWVRLTDADRSLVGQLVEQLPQILVRASGSVEPAMLENTGEDVLHLLERFKQVARTMRLCWHTQMGTAWEG